MRSNAEEAGFDLLVGPQLVRAGRIDDAAFAQHVHIVDQLQGQRGILLHQQDGKAFLLQLADRLPQALDDDRRQPLAIVELFARPDAR